MTPSVMLHSQTVLLHSQIPSVLLLAPPLSPLLHPPAPPPPPLPPHVSPHFLLPRSRTLPFELPPSLPSRSFPPHTEMIEHELELLGPVVIRETPCPRDLLDLPALELHRRASCPSI